MVKLKVGEAYRIGEAKHGEGSKGAYFFFPVKAEKGYDRITVWASNPAEAAGFYGSVKIAEIEDVSITNTKKDDGHGGEKWFTNYNITARLEQAEQKTEDVSGDGFDLDEIFGLK